MAVRVTNVENLQQLEAVVSGPDGANRLFSVTGIAPTFLGAGGVSTQVETFLVLVGPVLTRRQFVRAIATANLARTSLTLSAGPGGGSGTWSIRSVDADWDDESGQVELRVEVAAQSQNVNLGVQAFGFQVTILAEV